MTAAPQSLDDLDWTAEGHRPAGQPGTVRGAWKYWATLTDSGLVLYWRDGGYRVASAALAATFVPGPEWKRHCHHLHALPTWTCLTEAQCDALAREEEQ